MSTGSRIDNKRAGEEDEYAGGLFETPGVGDFPGSSGRGSGAGDFPGVGAAPASAPRVGMSGKVREAHTTSRVYGRGVPMVDPRKFGHYDRTRGLVMPPLDYGASKADRLDATEAGELLHKLHTVVGIDAEQENVLVAFDYALFHEHTINGGSLLQPGRGTLRIDQSYFDLATIKAMLGNDQRRFFRAFADEIADGNRKTLKEYDPYDPVSSEKYGQLMQVATERGLQKYPYLAHDSSDACLRLSVEERIALAGAKKHVLESTVNNVDKRASRVDAAVTSRGE